MAELLEKIKYQGIEYDLGGSGGGSGATFIPSIDDEGFLSWENDGGLPNPDPVKVRGENGAGIADISQNADDTLAITMDDGKSYKTKPVRGAKGDKGDDGDSAYQVALDNGFVGTEQEWLASLKGDKGEKGQDGTVAFDDLTEEQIQALKGDKGDIPNIVLEVNVDGTIGTPRVEVDKTGTDTDPVYNIQFSGLKGEKGDSGASGVNILRYTMTLTGWVDGEYSFESTFPFASYNLEIEPDGDLITENQLKAWNAGQMTGSFTANKCIAKGETPTTDIPIILKASSKVA